MKQKKAKNDEDTGKTLKPEVKNIFDKTEETQKKETYVVGYA